RAARAGGRPRHHHRRLRLGLRGRPAVRRPADRARLHRRPGARCRAAAAARPAPHGLLGPGHERGRRHAARPREGRRADRRRRHPQQHGRVPRQGPGRDGVDLPRPDEGGRPARRRQGREQALPQLGSHARPRVDDPGGRLHAGRGAHALGARPAGPPRLLALANLRLMVNFRFHIVSLTAVLLALGIGLVLGTTFLDEATVKGLERQLEGLEHDLDAAQARNDAQQERLGRFEDEAEQLQEQLGERLYDGQLLGQPVLVVSTQGVAQDWVDRVLTALTQAEADVLGVWWLSDRLTLDDDGEVADLAGALELTTTDNGRLHRSLATQLADVLYGAVDSPPEEQVAGDAAPAEPALLARLREAGFVLYQLPEGEDGDVVRLPSSRLQVVVVDGPEAAVPAGDLLVPVLTELTADGPMPVVVTQPSLPSGDD